MKRESWSPKHTMNLALVLGALASVVLLSVFAEGDHVEAVLAFVGGLLVPGSPLSAILGRERASGDDEPPPSSSGSTSVAPRVLNGGR